MKQKTEWKKVGTVGGCDVMRSDAGAGDGVCIVIDKTWFSPRKIKTLFANTDKAKAFLAEYDKPVEKVEKPAKESKVITVSEFEATKARLEKAEAMLAEFAAPRLSPEAINAAINAETVANLKSIAPVAQAA